MLVRFTKSTSSASATLFHLILIESGLPIPPNSLQSFEGRAPFGSRTTSVVHLSWFVCVLYLQSSCQPILGSLNYCKAVSGIRLAPFY